MPVNTMSFNQVATVLNSIQQQATGQAALTATTTADFISAAQTTLRTGYDPVINAINQVLSRTIFSVRPYNRKFGLAEVSESAYGNHIRKLNIADKPVKEDDRYKWPTAYDATQTSNPTGEGQVVSPFVVSKPTVLQTNFYGANVWADYYSLFKDQLDNAFRGPDELAGFVGMVTQNITDKLEQVRENMGRAAVSNFIGGILDNATSIPSRVVHLLTEYNTLTGLSLTATTVYQPANFRAFVQWAYARILTVSDMMTERSQEYQTIVNSLPIMRHTPKERQKMMIYSPASNMMTTMALSETYHDELVRIGAYETVNYWQSIKTPDSINVTPGYIGANGSVVTASQAVSQDNVFGVLFDEEALGYAVTQQWSAPSPFNARNGVTTIHLHETQRLWNDHSEKGVVFLLD